MNQNQTNTKTDNVAKRPINWTNLIFFVVTPVLTAVSLPIYFYYYPITWGLAAFFVISYTLTNMSITVGYHRLFAHRSFEASTLLETLIVLFGSAAFQGSVLQWCTDHRRHHLRVDTEEDPYSISKGFFYAHMGWILLQEKPEYRDKFARDLEKRKWLKFQHDNYWWVASLMAFVVPAFVGWALGFGFFGGLIVAGLLRLVTTQHSTFFINSLCHMVGRQPYSDTNSARDSFVMAVLTFGEGYHNFHHQFQVDYRNGIRWYHWDPTKWSIKFFAWLGLARRLKVVSPVDILRVRLQMDERRLLISGANRERVEALKAKIEAAQVRMRELADECSRIKKEVKAGSRERYRLLKAEMQIAQIDFKNSYAQWMIFLRAYSRGQARSQFGA